MVLISTYHFSSAPGQELLLLGQLHYDKLGILTAALSPFGRPIIQCLKPIAFQRFCPGIKNLMFYSANPDKLRTTFSAMTQFSYKPFLLCLGDIGITLRLKDQHRARNLTPRLFLEIMIQAYRLPKPPIRCRIHLE